MYVSKFYLILVMILILFMGCSNENIKSIKSENNISEIQIKSDSDKKIIINSKINSNNKINNYEIIDNITYINITYSKDTISPLMGIYFKYEFILNETSIINISVVDDTKEIIKKISSNQIFEKGINQIIWDGSTDKLNLIDNNKKYFIEISKSKIIDKEFEIKNYPEIKLLAYKNLRFSPANNPYGQKENNKIYLNYQINKKGILNITIYSENNVKIIELMNKHIKPGDYTISWNGKNIQNIPLTRGIYNVRFELEDNSNLSKKLNVYNEIYY